MSDGDLKQCSKCGEWYSSDHFFKSGELCGRCWKEVTPDWFEQFMKWCTQSARQEEIKEKRKNDPSIKEKNRIANKRWRAQYPEKARALAHRRRARKQSAPGKYTAEDIRQIKLGQTDKRGRLICWWCGNPIEGEYHADHRIPLSRGGSNGSGNIVIAHAFCNLSKHDQMPGEFCGRLL